MRHKGVRGQRRLATPFEAVRRQRRSARGRKLAAATTRHENLGAIDAPAR
jgi:hypothetical protein